MPKLCVLALVLAGCVPLQLGKNESESHRHRGGFVGAAVGGGISSFDCNNNCRSEAGDIGMAVDLGAVSGKARAIVLGGRWLYRPTTAKYSQGEVLLSYRRWLIPFLWVSGGGGLAWQRSIALVDTEAGRSRFGGAAVGSAAMELVISNNITFDIRVDSGVAYIPDGSYWFGVAGVGMTVYSDPIAVSAGR